MDERFTRAGQAFAQLCEIMATLRAPGGCPWDREQTLESLKPYLLEEAYETLDAIDQGVDAHREELGDLLLQVIFQAELRWESSEFDVADVADGIREKLVRRHPHVFGDAHADSASGALRNWEAMKAQEKGKDRSRLDGIPKALPALLRASRSGEKAASLGFDWPDAAGVRRKVDEELAELDDALKESAGAANEAVAEEFGDLLFAMANWARHLGLCPEATLHAAIGKFHRRFRHVEQKIAEAQTEAPERGILPLDALERLWEDAKSR